MTRTSYLPPKDIAIYRNAQGWKVEWDTPAFGNRNGFTHGHQFGTSNRQYRKAIRLVTQLKEIAGALPPPSH